MRRLVSAAMAAALLVALTACSAPSGADVPEPGEPAATETPSAAGPVIDAPAPAGFPEGLCVPAHSSAASIDGVDTFNFQFEGVAAEDVDACAAWLVAEGWEETISLDTDEELQYYLFKSGVYAIKFELDKATSSLYYGINTAE